MLRLDPARAAGRRASRARAGRRSSSRRTRDTSDRCVTPCRSSMNCATPAEPQHWLTLFQKPGVRCSGMPLASTPLRGLLHPCHPGLVAGDLRELIEEPRRAGRAVAPAQIEEVEAVGLIVLDEADVPFGPGDRLQIARSGERAIEEPPSSGRLVKRRQEVGDAGGAVREVRHHARDAGSIAHLVPPLIGDAQLQQAVGGANREPAWPCRPSACRPHREGTGRSRRCRK